MPRSTVESLVLPTVTACRLTGDGRAMCQQLAQMFDERHGIRFAGGDDAVADVNDLGIGRGLLQHGGERLIEIGPAQRNALI